MILIYIGSLRIASMKGLNLNQMSTLEVIKYLPVSLFSDSIFTVKGIHHAHKIVTPYDPPTSQREEEFNNDWASYQTVVENVIAHIRDWNICGGLFRLKDNQNIETLGQLHHCVWTTCAALVNRYVGPLRVY